MPPEPGESEDQDHHDREAPVPLLAGHPGVRPVEADDQRRDQEDRGHALDPALAVLVPITLSFGGEELDAVKGAPQVVAEAPKSVERAVDSLVDQLDLGVIRRGEPRLVQVLVEPGDIQRIEPVEEARSRLPEVA
jgi:hypothetical protein